MATSTTTARRTHATRLVAAGTSLRIVLVPILIGLVLAAGRDAHATAALAAALLFAVAAATDFLDGYLARRWRITTTLGSFLDTTADKILVTGVLVALVAVQRASPWIATAILARELIILGLRGVLAAEGRVMKPSPSGRIKTNVQFVAILLAIARPGGHVAGLFVDQWLMLAALIVSVLSGAEYLVRSGSASPAVR